MSWRGISVMGAAAAAAALTAALAAPVTPYVPVQPVAATSAMEARPGSMLITRPGDVDAMTSIVAPQPPPQTDEAPATDTFTMTAQVTYISDIAGTPFPAAA